MSITDKLYKITDFAKMCGVTPRTLKYYEERGLLAPAQIGENSYRYYSLAQIDEVSAILLFRDYGFSLEEIRVIMEQDDLAGIEQRMDMMLSIIGEQKKRLEEQEKNIRYTCAQVAQARPNLGVPFVEEHAVQRVNFEPVSLSPAHSFIINYLTDGLRSGTCFSMKDYTVCGRYQTDSQGITVLSGKSMCLYEMGFPRQELVRKVADAAKHEGIAASMVYCEMVLENVLPEKCLFQYFTGVHCDTAMGASRLCVPLRTDTSGIRSQR